jgi:hypothetical protein
MTRQHQTSSKREDSKHRTVRRDQDSNAGQKLATSSQIGNLTSVKCARCECDIDKVARDPAAARQVLLAVVFTVTQPDSSDRKLCADCWRKELGGSGQLLGARSEAR